MLHLLLVAAFSNSQSLHASDNSGKTSIEMIIGLVTIGTCIWQVKNIYDFAFPDKETIAKQLEAEIATKEANKRLKYLKAEANFSECLKSIKKDSPRNTKAIPTKCEEQARALILCDGKAAFYIMMDNFNS